MNRVKNDKIERYYFEQFQRHRLLPDGNVIYGDKPDVILHGTRKIGIEITNLYVQSGGLRRSEQEQRPLRASVVARAQQSYLANGGKQIELTFTFDRGKPIRPARVEQLSIALAEFARSCEDQASGPIRRSLFEDRASEIQSIYLNANEYADSTWRIVQLRTLGLMSKVNLEATIREKESKIGSYESCDAYWLLIVVDGMDSAQEQEVRIDSPRISSDLFENIIVFHTFGHVVWVRGSPPPVV